MGLGQIIGLISGLLIISAFYLKTGNGNKKLADAVFVVGFIGAVIFISALVMLVFED